MISHVRKRAERAAGRAPATRQAREHNIAAYPARPTVSPSRRPRASRNLESSVNRGPLTLRGVIAIAILIGIAALCALLIVNAVSGRSVCRTDRRRNPAVVGNSARPPCQTTLKTAVWPSSLGAFPSAICHGPSDRETPAFGQRASSVLAALQRNPSDRLVHSHHLPRGDEPSGDRDCERT